ncbi:MAG: hypothetical protein GTN78_17045, partial [Gemmatimonadales bacterium]|nr:hypothetical protein [Xanthomonadales bacterium]NIR01873.1 hypothetical protein [Gemmatimonadales bacterium]
AHAYGMAKPGQLQPETWELDAEDLAGELPDLVALLNVAVLRREFLGEPRSALGDAVQDWHR